MTRDADPKAGLLGKVAKFIKNPTVDWSDLDRGEPSGPLSSLNSRQSRLALKEMMARKRRNDLVRRHEFDKLRKIRHGGKAPGDGPNTMELNSLYSSSQLAHETETPDSEQKRKRTLRQIDEIEAELSQSWFSKAGTVPPTVPMRLRRPQAPPPPPGTPMLDPASATEPGKSRSSIPAIDFVPATLPAGSGVLGQPRSSSPVMPAPAPPAESGFRQKKPTPARPEPPVLTQTYPAPVASGKPNPPPPSRPPAPAPSRKQWKDPALDGLTIDSQPGGLDFQEPPAPAARRPDNRAPAPPPRSQAAAPPPRRAPPAYGNGLEQNIEVVALRQDPEIEEAAISFANGDEATAELMLLKLINAGGSRRKDVDVWLALFDLYRVTGKSDAFDGLAPEFITLFGRSAPQWERGQQGSAPASPKPAGQPAASRQGAFAWTSPAQFNARALTGLTSAVKRTGSPLRIDWRAVRAVEPDVLPQLNELLAQWADTPVQLQFLGDERLLAALAGQTPTGNKDINPAWWRVRLNLLRLTGSPDLFDQAALDYCITYEISPPAWTAPRSSYTSLSANGQPEAPGNDDAAAPRAFAPTTITGELLETTGVFETALEGEILGRADQMLDRLPQQLDRIQAFDFDCRALRRVDFGAAGALLNWSIEQQGQGRTVTFHYVHRLLAAFFSVMGINASAQVVLRKD